MSTLVLLAIPIFGLTMALEWYWLHGRSRRPAVPPSGVPSNALGYEKRDTAASLAMGLGNVILSALFAGVSAALFFSLHRFALFDIPRDAAWAWLLLIPLEDLCYYVFHRAHHEIRLLWAAHVNHHSSRYFNLSTALRQSWTTPFTGPIFWAPLALIGFDPLMILTAQGISLLYQYWIHTELIGDLGAFEAVMNTPSHHRVHHGRNVEYLDRNYAGIFIVWDRLFGSFEPERARVDYGITKNIESFNPIVIAFHEWAAILHDLRRAPSLRRAATLLLRPPGWSPDGISLTARQMQARQTPHGATPAL